MLQNNNLFNILSSSIVNNPDQLIFGSLFLSMVGFITYSIYKSSSTITTNVSTQTDSSLVNEQGIQTDNPLLEEGEEDYENHFLQLYFFLCF